MRVQYSRSNRWVSSGSETPSKTDSEPLSWSMMFLDYTVISSDFREQVEETSRGKCTGERTEGQLHQDGIYVRKLKGSKLNGEDVRSREDVGSTVQSVRVWKRDESRWGGVDGEETLAFPDQEKGSRTGGSRAEDATVSFGSDMDGWD